MDAIFRSKDFNGGMKMSLKMAVRITLGITICNILLLVLACFLGETETQKLLLYVVFANLFFETPIGGVFMRCPHCNKRVTYIDCHKRVCPHCGKEL